MRGGSYGAGVESRPNNDLFRLGNPLGSAKALRSNAFLAGIVSYDETGILSSGVVIESGESCRGDGDALVHRVEPAKLTQTSLWYIETMFWGLVSLAS